MHFFIKACELHEYVYSLFQVLKVWLEDIVTSLRGGSAETPEKQLASAVLVVYCIKKSSIHAAHLKVDQFTVPLLEMLCLRPDSVKHRCPDYAYLCQLLPEQCWYAKHCHNIMDVRDV